MTTTPIKPSERFLALSTKTKWVAAVVFALVATILLMSTGVISTSGPTTTTTTKAQAEAAMWKIWKPTFVVAEKHTLADYNNAQKALAANNVTTTNKYFVRLSEDINALNNAIGSPSKTLNQAIAAQAQALEGLTVIGLSVIENTSQLPAFQTEVAKYLAAEKTVQTIYTTDNAIYIAK